MPPRECDEHWQVKSPDKCNLQHQNKHNPLKIGGCHLIAPQKAIIST